MPKLSVYNISGQATGEEIELNDLVFGVEFNEAVVHQAIVMQQAAERQGTSATKTRAHQKRGFRRRQKALETKRHRPRSQRFYPFSDLGRWWYHFWSPTSQLCEKNAP